MAKQRVVCIVGTRPDAIKSAPVVVELRRYSESVETLLISTGQHREMLAQALRAFDLTPDQDLDIMTAGQSLAEVTTRALSGLDRLLSDLQPDVVLAQGDTTTTFVAALASFYQRVPFAHVEAGLRTPSVDEPFPEEFNRRAAGQLASLHFAPTPWSAENLRREGVAETNIWVTGNTGIDAVQWVAARESRVWYPEHNGRLILLTTHRRENWGSPQISIAEAARALLDEFQDTLLVVPMHKNPVVRESLVHVLGLHPRAELIEPPEYGDFVKLMESSALILTDSGGVQEEAPTFGVPVLVLRETTERPEGVEAGVAKLAGTDRERILRAARPLLHDSLAHQAMALSRNPYGDGRAAARIRYALLRWLGVESPPEAMWT